MLGKVLALGSAAALVAAPVAAAHGTGTFLGSTHGHRSVASTVPANGDLNPYGVAVVPRTVGRLAAVCSRRSAPGGCTDAASAASA